MEEIWYVESQIENIEKTLQDLGQLFGGKENY
jgi:hypothetical protein